MVQRRNTPEVAEDEIVTRSLAPNRPRQASRPDLIPTGLWELLGKKGVSWLTVFFNKLASGDRLPSEWRKSFLMALFKGKGNQLRGRNYGKIKFISHTRRKEKGDRLRNIVNLSDNQFGLMPGTCTMKPIINLRQVTGGIESHRGPVNSL